MTSSSSYQMLDYLSNEIGPRLSGSLGAERAVKWGRSELLKIGFDRVWLQDVMVPKWVRGPKEFALIETQPGITFNVDVCALGGSVATPSVGIKSNVVEVKSFDELKKLGKENIDGKIVFYNRPMQPNLVSTFKAYGLAVDQRVSGAAEAVKYGAIGVVVRSMNLRLDDYPHTGTMSYGNLPPSKRIPAAAISTNAAEKLSKLLKINPNLKFLLRQQCKSYEDVKSHNVIAEIKGTEFPDEIILVGGHLDSWDIGDGSHDDGAGIVQSIDIINIFKKEGIKTISSTFFTPELNISRGNYTKYEADNDDKREIKNAIKFLNKSKPFSYIQAAVGRNNSVILEKRKGTQDMLKNIKKQKNKNSGVLVKFPQKKQDKRIDLPTIGLHTIKQCKLAGLKGIVLKHKNNIFLDKNEVINFANNNKMFILVK